MDQQDTMHALLPYLPFVILLLILLRRARTPRVVKPQRMWIALVIFVFVIGFYVYAAIQHGPPLHPLDWLIIAAAVVVGTVVGVIRAHLVHVTLRPDGQLETRLPLMGVAFILVWFVGRQLLRNSGWVNANAPFGVYADAGLALAFGLLVAHTITLQRRCQALLAQGGATTANVQGRSI